MGSEWVGASTEKISLKGQEASKYGTEVGAVTLWPKNS